MAVSDQDGGLELAAAPGASGTHRFSHEAMATIFEVHAACPDAAYAAQAAHAAFALVDRLEAELSRFIPNSDIGRINALSPGATTRVCPTTMECLVIARHMFAITGGAFDASIGTGMSSLAFDPEGCTITATQPGVRLDLGAIGKGYAVDLMAELLEDWGLERALVHGGFSSVLALEPPEGQDGWPLTLSDPAESSTVLATVSARQTAFSASGLRKGDHIRDPRSGEPVRGRRAAWAAVARPDAAARDGIGGHAPRLAAAAVADALTTALMLMRIDDIETLCHASPGLEAWVLVDPVEGRATDAAFLHFGER
jgi:thiamine biosynthesis lipoprotein